MEKSRLRTEAAAPRGLRPTRNHRWHLTPREAIALQNRMRASLILRGGPRSPKLIAGADVAYSKEHNRCFAMIVVLRMPELETVEIASAQGPVSFPYVPGLLSFREGPIVLKALARLHSRPDVIIFDGHGLAHPRRFGLASHIGYLLDVPSIGCAKSILVGEHEEVSPQAGEWSWLVHNDERIGVALRTRTGVRPVYISPGYRVGFGTAIKIALSAVTKYRVPEPTRLADIMVGRFKREWLREMDADKDPPLPDHRQGAGYSPVSRKRM